MFNRTKNANVTPKKIITDEIDRVTEVIRVLEDRAVDLEVNTESSNILIALKSYKKGLVFARDSIFTKESNA